MFVVDWLHKQAQHHPDKLALVDSASGRALSYRQFDERASRFAQWVLERWRLSPGDRVAVLARNGPEYLEMLYGCAKAGVVMVCLNWRLPAAELGPILDDAGPAALVCDEGFLEVARALFGRPGPTQGDPAQGGPARDEPARDEPARDGQAPTRAALPGLVLSPAPAAHEPATAAQVAATVAGLEWPDYESALAAAGARVVEMPTRPMDEPWYLLYTSGTTGRPKGVIQTYGMSFFNAVNAMLATGLSGRDVLLAALPFFHTGGLNLYANPIIHAGGTVVVMRDFDAGEAIRWLDGKGRDAAGSDERAEAPADPGDGPARRPLPITQFLGVPALYLFIAQHPGFGQARFEAMRHWSAGGSPMPLALLETWSAKGITICFGFGMTETGPTVFIPDEATARAKPGSVGKPVGSMLARVVDRDGRDCGPGERGELLVRGPGVTPGYWRNPQATAEALRDGWLHTGDVAYFDEDGDYWIVDRLKDMFVSGGENVYPAEVENLLYRMPGVAEAAVIGVPDPRWVEVGLAVIVPAAGARLSEDAVREHCRAQLAGYKVPKHVRFVDALPRTPAGKVEKPALRARFAA